MSSPEDKFKINLNQNLWGLLLGFVSLGVAEYYQLSTLFWFSCVVSGIMTVSVGATTFVYTVNYWKNKSWSK
jgi:hypothetical protein